jgi:hypothetical protein
MVPEALVGNRIEVGHHLLDCLDRKSAGVQAAFWYFDAESMKWIFQVASRSVDLEGSRKMYKIIQDGMRELNIRDVTLADVSVTGVNDWLVQLVKRYFGFGKNAEETRLQHLSLGGEYIHDMYIYRMK